MDQDSCEPTEDEISDIIADWAENGEIISRNQAIRILKERESYEDAVLQSEIFEMQLRGVWPL